jgi:acyl dehydratase
MTQACLYFEDFVVGQTVKAGSRTVSEQEIIDFATQFDPQPFHVDKELARKSIYGGLIASGWHTCSLMMRLVVDGFLPNSASLGSPGVEEVRWLRPVRAGDTVQVSTTTIEKRPSSSRPDRGLVITYWEATNQHGEVVATMKGLGMFGRRPVESTQQGE